MHHQLRPGERRKSSGQTRLHRRRRVAWLAATALLFQLFITQVHAFMGGEILHDTSRHGAAAQAGPAADVTFLCHYDPGHYDSNGPASPAADSHATHHSECPIYQMLPIVSAALASGFVELPAPPQHPIPADAVAARAEPRAIASGLRPRPRAPPIQA